jgi:hypothetical protein
LALGTTVLVVVGGAVWLNKHSPPPARSNMTTGALAPKAAPERRLVARVGEVQIFDADVERYTRLTALTVGIGPQRQALRDLCDRTLLVLAARDAGITVDDAIVNSGVLRKLLLVGALAKPDLPGLGGMDTPGIPRAPGVPGGPAVPGVPGGPGAAGIPGTPGVPGVPGGPGGPRAPGARAGIGAGDPIGRGRMVLADEGITEAELSSDVRDDALAEKVRRARVYDKIVVPDEEVLAFLNRDAKGDAGKADQPKTKDSPEFAQARERMLRQRGAAPLRELLAELATKWKVELADH